MFVPAAVLQKLWRERIAAGPKNSKEDSRKTIQEKRVLKEEARAFGPAWYRRFVSIWLWFRFEAELRKASGG